MRKSLCHICLILIVSGLAGSISGGSIKSYHSSFFGIYGKRAMVMGKADGSALEVWVYPYKVLHNYKMRVKAGGIEQDVYSNIYRLGFSHECFEREFVGESWKITERLYPSLDEPIVYLVYDIDVFKSTEIHFTFKPDLSPMWPAAIGGKYSYWDEKGYFVISESTGNNFAIIGADAGKNEGSLPAHNLPGGLLNYKLELAEGSYEIPIVITAGYKNGEELEKLFEEARKRHREALEIRKKHITKFKNEFLKVTTPDADFNEALEWAMLNLNFAFVNNPQLGEGLVAGYGLSGESDRPGFGWFFGGDGLINSFAIADCGDLEGARKEIEFLFRYQREDGKIIHELSQGAQFVNWFTDYGFPYFHGDTTLFFITFLDFYVKRSADRDILLRFRKKIDKAFEWTMKCDSDSDGIVETKLAGAGASETGPLRQKMKTDIFLAELSAKAWEGFENIYTLLGDSKKVKISRERAAQAKKEIDNLFWDETGGYYSYAIRDDGSKIDEVTIWPAIGMRFGVFDVQKGRLFARKIASPELSSDWGTRFLSTASKYYDPVSYNNGAVWPFLTGFSSIALYKYGSPWQAFSFLEANVRIILDYDYGCGTELLSGRIYRPLDESVQNQIWTSGNTVSAFVEGLLGFDGNAIEKKIVFKPKIPLHWEFLTIENLRLGEGTMNLSYKRVGGRIDYKLGFKNLNGYTVVFEPVFDAYNTVYEASITGFNEKKRFIISGQDESVDITALLSGYVYPYVPKELSYGGESKAPIIDDLVIKNDGFELSVWSEGESCIWILTDKNFTCKDTIVKEEKDYRIVLLQTNSTWQKNSMKCSFIEQ